MLVISVINNYEIGPNHADRNIVLLFHFIIHVLELWKYLLQVNMPDLMHLGLD